MGPPTIIQHIRQLIGRAFRETGQALDRLGIKTASLAITKHDFYDDPVIYEDINLSRHRQIFPLLTSGRPILHPEISYIAPCSTLIGTVTVGKGSSIWYGSILRGDQGENAEAFNKIYNIEDNNKSTNIIQPWELKDDRLTKQTDHHGGGIFIGENTNIQDNCIITARTNHTNIGNGITIGHLTQIHSATIHDYCLIGMGSIINTNVIIETESLIAAGSVIPSGTIVKSGELWVGNPAKKLRNLTLDERKRLHYQSSEYVKVAQTHKNIMKLGGNVDANGASVYIIEEETKPLQLEDDDFEEDEIMLQQQVPSQQRLQRTMPREDIPDDNESNNELLKLGRR